MRGSIEIEISATNTDYLIGGEDHEFLTMTLQGQGAESSIITGDPFHAQSSR